MTIAIRRSAAVGAALSGLLHLFMLSHGHHLGWALAMAAMAIICLPCAGHLWRAPSPRSWITIAIMNAAMLGVHLWMLSADRPGSELRKGSAGEAGGTAQVDPSATGVSAAHSHSSSAETAIAGVAPGAGAHALHDLLVPLASSLAACEILLALAGLALLRRRGWNRQGMHAQKRPLHDKSTGPWAAEPILDTAHYLSGSTPPKDTIDSNPAARRPSATNP